MKTITLTDEELQELRTLLHAKISNYLNDVYIISSDGVKHEVNSKADVYKRLYNKIIAHVFKA